MAYGLWFLADDAWPIACCLWTLAGGLWLVADGLGLAIGPSRSLGPRLSSVLRIGFGLVFGLVTRGQA